MTDFAIQLAIRFAVFGAVLIFALRKREEISVKPKWAVPLVALAIALFNAGLYPVLAPVLKLAALGLGFLVVPLALNGALLWAMKRYTRFLHIEGFKPLVWLTALITGAHAVLYTAFYFIFG